jgi:hypothetical protein
MFVGIVPSGFRTQPRVNFDAPGLSVSNICATVLPDGMIDPIIPVVVTVP